MGTVDETTGVVVTNDDKEVCLRLFFQVSMDRVYLHTNGKKVIGSLKIGKHRHKVDLSDDIQYVLHPDLNPGAVRGAYRKPLVKVDVIYRCATNLVIDEFVRMKGVDKKDWNLSAAYSRSIEPFLKEHKEHQSFVNHCQSILEFVKDECRKMQHTGILRKKLTGAQKLSAIKKLRPKLVAVAKAGLEEEDILELWNLVIVEDVLKS